eukprot:jgi/Psemu1/3653/gm1.3653_g
MVDPFDWNAIEGIRFRFKGNSPYDEQLNALYSQIMDDIDMEDLFVENADAKVLAPFMMTNLRGSVVNAITYCLPSLTASQKGHITQLLSGCTISYVTYTGATKKVRGPIDLEKAAKEALTHHTHASTKPIITIELVITEWQFKSTWRAHRFDKVYAIPIPVPSPCVNIPPFNPRESPVEPTIPVPSQTNNALTFNDKLIEQLKQERHGDTLQHVLPPKRTYRCKHQRKSPITAPNSLASAPPTTADLLPVQAMDSILDTPAPSSNLINPVKPAKPNASTAVKVRLPYMTRSLNNTNLNNSNSADQPVDCQVADTPTANAPMPNKAPHYAWTWTYSPNSASISFRRVRSGSISFQRATSSSPPIQRQDKPSTVIAPSVSPSALTRFGHHPVLPSVPTNFGWTFNPQKEIATFRRLQKSALSPQPSMCNRLLPSGAIAEGTDLPNAAPAYIRSLKSPCHNQIFSRPNRLPVL